MRVYNLFWLFLIMICCKDPVRESQDSKSISNGTWTDSIEYYYERDQYENLKLRDTLLGFMGFSSIDNYQLFEINDRVYRLTIFEAIGAKFTIIEVFCDSSKHLLRFWKYKLDKDCYPVTGTRKFSENCFIKQENFEKKLSAIECDSINSLLNEEEIFDLKEISQKFRDAVILDGEEWQLDIRYMIHDARTDSNFIRTHTVDRFLPEEFHSIFTVGNYIRVLSAN